MKKCVKMMANSSELLFYCHDCMSDILNNFCIITSGVVLGEHRPLLNFKSQCYFQYDTTKKLKL